jgi:hypothetical protein
MACVVLAACGPFNRVALPAPFPLTAGGTTSPSHGVGGGLALNDALRGQEVQRTELYAFSAAAGLGDRVSFALARFQGHLEHDPWGTQVSAKVRVGTPFGNRTSTAIHVASAGVWLKHDSSTALGGAPARIIQDERVIMFDLAVPTEVLVKSSTTGDELSAYAGPRMTAENYYDYLHPVNSLHHTYLGLVGGLHGRAGHLHLFVEATLLHVPSVQYLGVAYGDRWTVLPNIGVSFNVGPSHRWAR